MKTTVTPHKSINQSQLKKLLNLPSYVVRHLKGDGTLKFHRVGTEDVFDETSVKSFMESFNRSDYLTIGECKKILDKWDFYTHRSPKIKFYYFPLGFYVSVKVLIEGNSDVPSQYRLETRDFGKTTYISRKSFAKTLNWMRHIHHKEHPKGSSNFQLSAPLVKKPMVKGLKGTKKIGLKKTPTPHPMVIPSMVCPLSPITQ